MIHLLAASPTSNLALTSSTALVLALEKAFRTFLVAPAAAISRCLSAASATSAARHSTALWPVSAVRTAPPSARRSRRSTEEDISETELPGGYLPNQC